MRDCGWSNGGGWVGGVGKFSGGLDAKDPEEGKGQHVNGKMTLTAEMQ